MTDDGTRRPSPERVSTSAAPPHPDPEEGDEEADVKHGVECEHGVQNKRRRPLAGAQHQVVQGKRRSQIVHGNGSDHLRRRTMVVVRRGVWVKFAGVARVRRHVCNVAGGNVL